MTGPELIAAVSVIGSTGWVVSLAWHPYQPCPRCEGRRGQNVGSKKKRWGRCGKCGGKGERLRRGARPVRKAIGRPL